MITQKSENKILIQNSVHIRPGQEYSGKNRKKIQKIIKPFPSIIFSQNRMRLAEKVKTKFYSRIPFLLDPGKKIPKKNSKKIQKIIKPLPGIFFYTKRDEIGRKSENKILLQNSVHTRTGQENSEKKILKKLKNYKTSSQHYF